jgi:hypothetical protein
VRWRRNKRLVADGYADLEWVPHGRAGWDLTLACLAYGIRMEADPQPPGLNAWATRHGVCGSGRCEELGENALVLWHGTTRKRADLIAEHGLFHKRGLWTARHPGIPHGFCRGRSERFGGEGAVVCIVVDARDVPGEAEFETDNVVRFHHSLPPEVVEYVLVGEEIRFTGSQRTRRPAPWPGERFARQEGEWAPTRRAPVRYSEEVEFSSPRELAAICVDRLLDELGDASALEVFSCVYAAVRPSDALPHRELLGLIEQECIEARRHGRWRTFRRRPEGPGVSGHG